jgi:regulator of ribonuclease activity A
MGINVASRQGISAGEAQRLHAVEAAVTGREHGWATCIANDVGGRAGSSDKAVSLPDCASKRAPRVAAHHLMGDEVDQQHRLYESHEMTTLSFATCDLCDAHEEDASGAFRVLPPGLRDFGAPGRFGGPVATVRCLEDNSRVREAVNSPGEGRVLVVDGGGSVRRALVGGNLARAAASNGWAGIVVDGAVRDAAELAAAGIGIKALALMPMRSVKRGEGQRDLPVVIQGVPVRPGDWLYADADGIVLSATSLA